jgi:hypothetical protein
MIEKTELAHILILEEPNAVVKAESNVCSQQYDLFKTRKISKRSYVLSCRCTYAKGDIFMKSIRSFFYNWCN